MKKMWKAVSSFSSALWAGKASRALLVAAVLLLAAAAVIAVCLFDEGVTAANNAETLMQAYDEAVSAETHSTEPADKPVFTAKPEPTPVTVDGYPVIGKLEIPEIDLELPVIAFTDDKALKVSVCYFQGPMPGEEGNLVITGHHYASGAHFGRLNELKEGDEVTLSLTDGSIWKYTVFRKQQITPDDPKALNDYEGTHVLTLLTCTNQGNSRLLVRCSLDDSEKSEIRRIN